MEIQQAIEWQKAFKRTYNGQPKEVDEACDLTIKALEEIQQYREIEAEIKEQYHANVDIKKLMRCFIETIFKGEKHEGFCILTNDDAKMWEKYRAIGTVEECREAREKQIPKKPKHNGCYDNDGVWHE